MNRLASAFALGCIWVFILVAAGFILGRATAIPPSVWTPPPDSLFRDVATPRPTGAPRAGTFEEPAPRSVRAIGAVPSTKGGDAGLTTDRSDTMPRRSPSTTTAAGRLFGLATWYGTSGPGTYGAAGPALRVGDWRGSVVVVCAADPATNDGTSRCVTVILNDWCQCGDRGGSPTLLDLSVDAFAQLGPLSRGVLRVEVTR